MRFIALIEFNFLKKKMYYETLLVCFGVMLGHIGSQYLSFKNPMFHICNRYLIEKVDHKYQKLKRFIFTKMGYKYTDSFEKSHFQNQMKNMMAQLDPSVLENLSNIFGNINKELSRVDHHFSHQSSHHKLNQRKFNEATSLPESQSPETTTEVGNRLHKRKPLRKPSSLHIETEQTL
jgi:hypothetical protein